MYLFFFFTIKDIQKLVFRNQTHWKTNAFFILSTLFILNFYYITNQLYEHNYKDHFLDGKGKDDRLMFIFIVFSSYIIHILILFNDKKRLKRKYKSYLLLKSKGETIIYAVLFIIYLSLTITLYIYSFD